MKSELGRTTFC